MSDCVPWYKHLLTGALSQEERDCLAAEERAQIQSVPDNVAKYYPNNTDAQLAAQREADRQKAQADADQNTLQAGECPGVDLGGIGFGCIRDFNDLLSKLGTTAKVLLAILALGVTLYVVALVAPLIPRGRK